MTLSSVMFYTGENPYTHEPVYVARTQEEKRRQKSYFFRPGQAGAAPAKRAPRGAGHAAAQDSARGAGGGPEHDSTRSSSRDANRGVKRGQAAGSGKFPAKAPARTGQSERFERSDRREPRGTTSSGRRPGRAKNGQR